MANDRIKLAETNNNFRMKPIGFYITAEEWFGESEGRGVTLVYAKGLLDGDGNIVYDANDREGGGIQQVPRLQGTEFNNFMNETLGEFLVGQGLPQATVDAITAVSPLVTGLTFKEQIVRKMNTYSVDKFAGAVLEDNP